MLSAEEARGIGAVETRDVVGHLDEPRESYERAGDHERQPGSRVARAKEAERRQREQQIAERAGKQHDHALN
jgi:hypothetical protein